MFKKLLFNFIKHFLGLEENKSRKIDAPNKILIVRQHNQFGDLLASVSLFRAIKESYANCELSVIVSPKNYYAVTKNEFIDKQFIFDKAKLLQPDYLSAFHRFLQAGYDLTLVPVTVSISFTSCFLGRLSKSKCRIGPKSLNGKPNAYDFLFDRRVNMDWRRNPDTHISDFGLEILRPFGIATKNFRSSISFDENDIAVADEFISAQKLTDGELLIGLHVGAGKPQNRWSLQKFIILINELNKKYSAKYFFTGSASDSQELKFIGQNLNRDAGYFLNQTIPELAALISKCDLFITNDTGVMHVAGATATPQISIFGPTNPFNWAPIGMQKYFIRKSELIDDVTVDDILSLCNLILKDKRKKITHEEKNISCS